MTEFTISILCVLLCVAAAGLFAGAETGIYQLSRIRLRLGIEKKKFLYILLGKVMHNSSNLLHSLLIGTNLAYYIATSIVTYMLLSNIETERATELTATFITTPVLFIFSELIPKSIFYYRSDSLMPVISPFLYFTDSFFRWTGVVPFFAALSGAFSTLSGVPRPSAGSVSSVGKHQIAAVLKETHKEGLFSPVQADIVNRLAIISSRRISEVMIPVSKVAMAEQTSGRTELLKILREHSFTRIPVYSNMRSSIIGFINIYECLACKKDFSSLLEFITPILKLNAETSVSEAINTMQIEKQKIAVVVKTGHLGRKRCTGILTMKDLVEELLGEISEW